MLKFEVYPDSGLSKNGLNVMTVGQLKALRNARRNVLDEGFFLGMEAMQIHGSWTMLEKAFISIEQFYSNVPYDYDGLACVVAPYIDGFVKAGVLKDDSPRIVKDYKLKATKVKKRDENKVVIKIGEYVGDE